RFKTPCWSGNLESSFSVASENVTVRSGQSVVLPCWLSPAADAQAMEVRWYRPEQYSRPVLLYREQKILTSSQPERFRNRAALGSPGGLKRGNVSLRIDNVTFADAGPYECYVSSELLYSSALVFLNVSAKPLQPSLNRATAHHHVVVSEDRKYLRDSEKTGDNTEMGRFHHHTCVLGEPGFSSGCKYWEVVLKQENIDVKAAWWVGLASGSADRSTEAPLTPSGGFWYLSSDGSNGYHVNLDPTFPVSLSTRPGTLGVLVEYEKGRLTFYDVGEKKPILTLVTAFTGDVFPLFNPGTGDSGSVHIPDMIPPSVEAEEQPLLNTDTLNTENETEATVPTHCSPGSSSWLPTAHQG
uniref:Uncharacterized protein n=1 Tax=Denticeps clupeoides TaxID=299321 RepID=A0AAY4DFG9_9TELE